MSNPARKSSWTPERRARHAAAIRLWAPWTRSTGPRTVSGKQRSAQNAYKHGNRAAPMRLLQDGLAAQNKCLRLARTYGTAWKLKASNELLARIRCLFLKYDHIFHVKVAQHLYYRQLEQKEAHSPPWKRESGNENTKRRAY